MSTVFFYNVENGEKSEDVASSRLHWVCGNVHKAVWGYMEIACVGVLLVPVHVHVCVRACVCLYLHICFSSVTENCTNSQRQVWQASTPPSFSVQHCHCKKPNPKNRSLIKRYITVQQMLSVMVLWPSSLIGSDGCPWSTWITCSYNDQAHGETLPKPGAWE